MATVLLLISTIAQVWSSPLPHTLTLTRVNTERVVVGNSTIRLATLAKSITFQDHSYCTCTNAREGNGMEIESETKEPKISAKEKDKESSAS